MDGEDGVTIIISTRPQGWVSNSVTIAILIDIFCRGKSGKKGHRK